MVDIVKYTYCSTIRSKLVAKFGLSITLMTKLHALRELAEAHSAKASSC